MQKKLLKICLKLGLFGLILYAVLFAVFYFDLDGKLLYYVVEPFLAKHYDSIERKNPFDSAYEQVPEGKDTL